ncbi:MAG: hypothetical protein Q9162_002101 [Coniocarpon cinnabarinum]
MSFKNRQSAGLELDPLDIHGTLAGLNFHSSESHFAKVDDYFDNSITLKNRASLELLTKDLQVISSDIDSHLANAEIASINIHAIRRAHKIISPDTSSTNTSSGTASGLDYISSSMEKQKMWLGNYKNSKDANMGLVFNLVTQQNATNNMDVALDMKKDSISMHAIATLTMVFLPGTFTATMLSAGIFTAVAGTSAGVAVSSIWWLWVAITVPLTLGVIVCWYIFQHLQNKRMRDKRMQGTSDSSSAPKDAARALECLPLHLPLASQRQALNHSETMTNRRDGVKHRHSQATAEVKQSGASVVVQGLKQSTNCSCNSSAPK